MYDGENRLLSVDGGSTARYFYDATGKRVAKGGAMAAGLAKVVGRRHGLAAQFFPRQVMGARGREKTMENRNDHLPSALGLTRFWCQFTLAVSNSFTM